MLTVTILGILATIAAPSFATLIATQRATTTAIDMYIAMTKTRSEAVKADGNVWLCPKTAGATGWHNGWQIQASDCAALSGTPLDDHAAIGGSTIAGPTSVIYQSSGRVQGSVAPAFAITVSMGSSSSTKYLCVDLSGRPLVQASSCS
jgi:type IV fimbrial biogenesis protein FimT